MAAQSSQFQEHYVPGLYGIVGAYMERWDEFFRRLLTTGDSERSYEEVLGAAGLPPAQLKPEGTGIVRAEPIEGQKVRATHRVTALAMEITREARMDDLYVGRGSAIEAGMTQIADSLRETNEIEGHRMFNAEAFLTSAVPTELQPLQEPSATRSLYSTAHPAIAGGEAGTQANRPSTAVDLTVASYRAGLTQMSLYTDDRGKKIMKSMPDTLLVNPQNQWLAEEITRNPTRIDTANDVVNVTRGITTPVSDPYCEDVNAWFLLNTQKNYLHWFDRERAYMDSWVDNDTQSVVVAMGQRNSIRVVHWLWTYASPGQS